MLHTKLFLLFHMCIKDVLCIILTYPVPIELHNNTDYRRGLLGGRGSHISRHPYLAAVIYAEQAICCASIIAPKWLLTSDNCINQMLASHFQVRVGSADPHVGGQLLKVKKFHPYPDNFMPFGHDLALIQLEEKIEYTDWAMPIRISKEAPYTSGTKVVVSGWGYSSPKAENLSVVEDVYKIIPAETCFDNYPHPADYPEMTEWTMCTFRKGHSPCLWDSGNPMIYEGELIAIFSFTADCINTTKPQVWTDACWHKRWTRSTINDRRNSDWWEFRKNKNKWNR